MVLIISYQDFLLRKEIELEGDFCQLSEIHQDNESTERINLSVQIIKRKSDTQLA